MGPTDRVVDPVACDSKDAGGGESECNSITRKNLCLDPCTWKSKKRLCVGKPTGNEPVCEDAKTKKKCKDPCVWKGKERKCYAPVKKQCSG